jgi:hypothetical protein
MPRGSCSGEISAGNEPIERTLEAIDWITSVGAFPTVCVFRPLEGSAMEKEPPPRYEDMRRVMKHMRERCRDRGVPIGLAPNIEVSLVVQPTDAAYLADGTLKESSRAWTVPRIRTWTPPGLRKSSGGSTRWSGVPRRSCPGTRSASASRSVSARSAGEPRLRLGGR